MRKIVQIFFSTIEFDILYMLDFSCVEKLSLVSSKILIGKLLISTDVTDSRTFFRNKASARLIVNHFWHVRSYTVLLSFANDDLRWFSCKTSGGQRGLRGISKFVSPRLRPGNPPFTVLPLNVDLQNELYTRLVFLCNMLNHVKIHAVFSSVEVMTFFLEIYKLYISFSFVNRSIVFE